MRVSRTFIAAAPSVLLVGAGAGAGTAVAAPAHNAGAAAPHAASVLASSRFDDGSFDYPVSTPGWFIEFDHRGQSLQAVTAATAATAVSER